MSQGDMGEEGALWAISYTSVACRALSMADLDDLLFDAQAFNQRMGVTGALCYDRGVFIQYVEGTHAAVTKAYQRIRASDLHTDINELTSGPVTSRQFDGWYMAFCQTPQSLMQVLANAGWEENVPVTRSEAQPNRGLSLLLYHWNRWIAGGRQDAGMALGETASG